MYTIQASLERSCLCAVERQAEAVATHERQLAEREASLQNEQEQLQQQQAMLEESSTTVEKERLEARDMLKVHSASSSMTHHAAAQHCVVTSKVWPQFQYIIVHSN